MRPWVLTIALLLGLSLAVDAATMGSDTFTRAANADLSAHTSDSGHSWTIEAGVAEFTVEASTDELNHSGTVDRLARLGVSVGDDDMDVSITVITNTGTNRRIGPVARMNTTDFTNALYCYLEGKGAGVAMEVQMFKRVGGTETQLGATHTTSITANSETHTLELQIRAGSQKCLLDGVEVVTATEADTTLQGNMYGGLFMKNHAGIGRLDNFLLESVATASRVVIID